MPPISDENTSGVAVDGADVLVAGDRPEAGAVGLGVPVHGVLAAQRGEGVVRDGVDERVVVGEVDVVAWSSWVS